MPSHRPGRSRSSRRRREGARRPPSSSKASSRPARAGQGAGRPGHPASASQRSTAQVRDPFLGRTIGGYKVRERTASGPTYLTFEAEQPAMGRRVILKVLTEEAAADEPTLLSFYRTARFAARVHHPNILDIYDVSSADGLHYCATEHVEGRSVGDLLRAREKIPCDDAIRVAIDVAQALRAANGNDVPGAALSLDRVILTNRGEVKLLLPTLIESDAPVLDDGYVRTAVGVLLYAMLSGGRASGIAEALQPGSAGAPELPPIKRVAIGTRQDIADVVDRLIGAGEAEPFASLDTALGALRGLLQAQERADTRLRTTTDRARRRQKRTGLYLGLAIGAMVLAFAVIIGVAVHGSSATGRVRSEFASVHGSVKALLKQAEGLQKAFNRAPTEQGAASVVSCYQQAVAHYRKFISEFPESDEARQAAAHRRQVEGFIPVFQGDAQRRMRSAAVNAAIRAIHARFKAEVEEKKKTGGTLDLARWRVEFTGLVDQHGGARDVAHTVQTWLDALPRMVQRGQMAIDAEQIVRDCATKYGPKRNYRACIRAWEVFHNRYRKFSHLRDDAIKRHDEELNKMRRGAAMAYFQLDGEAKRLIAQGDPNGARAIYQRIVGNFGFDSLVNKAKAELAKLPKG